MGHLIVSQGKETQRPVSLLAKMSIQASQEFRVGLPRKHRNIILSLTHLSMHTAPTIIWVLYL